MVHQPVEIVSAMLTVCVCLFVFVCVCVFPLTMSPGQWPPTNMNHGSNDAGCVHEEVVSAVLPVLVNLTGPDTSVVPPWGGKNTVGVGRRCVCDHQNTSKAAFHTCSRLLQDRGALLMEFLQIPEPLFVFCMHGRASQHCCLHILSGRQAVKR